MSAENFTYQYMKARMSPDNRDLKKFLEGRSYGFRQMIYRNLVKLDCAKELSVRQLHVSPKARLVDTDELN